MRFAFRPGISTEPRRRPLLGSFAANYTYRFRCHNNNNYYNRGVVRELSVLGEFYETPMTRLNLILIVRTRKKSEFNERRKRFGQIAPFTHDYRRRTSRQIFPDFFFFFFNYNFYRLRKYIT